MSYLQDKAANGTKTTINGGKQVVTSTGNSYTKGNSVKGSYVDYSGGSKKTSGTVNTVVNSQKNNTTAQNKAKTATNNVSSKSYNTTYTNNGGTKKTGGSDDKNKGQNQTVYTTVTSSDEIGGSPLWNDSYEDDVYEKSSGYDDSYIQELLAAQKAEQDRLAAEQEAAQKAAIQAGIDQAVNSLNAQKTTTAQDYADAYRQLYIQQMNAQKNINQQLAAQGQTGGAAESTLLGLETNYEDNLRQGKTAEQNALAALEQAITDAKLSGSIESANATATTAQNKANAYLTAYQNALSAAQTAAQYQATQSDTNRNYAYQIAMSMLQSGAMPSDAVLSSAGISKSDANTIVAQYQSSKTAKSGSGSGSNVSNDTYSTILKNAQTLANNQGKTQALAYLKAKYNSTDFDNIAGSKSDAYNAMVNQINSMF